MISGLILFNKPPGITSFDALRDIKRSLGTGKVGHTGTLDKFASGLLIVLVGKALKLSKYFTACDKKYEGRIHFGIETDTLDPEGNIIAEANVPAREEVEKAFLLFTGKIMQEPPAYSAIHINGKRASELARSGNAPEMKKRPVTIHSIELLSWELPFADIKVHCSSGTYIRSLARDIALAAGSRGHLCKLERTHVGDFELSFAETSNFWFAGHGEYDLTLAETQRRQERREEERIFINPINRAVIANLGMAWIDVENQEVEYLKHGKPLDFLLKNKPLISSATSRTKGSMPPRLCESSSFEPLAVFCGKILIAIIEQVDGKWKYACVFPSYPP